MTRVQTHTVKLFYANDGESFMTFRIHKRWYQVFLSFAFVLELTWHILFKLLSVPPFVVIVSFGGCTFFDRGSECGCQNEVGKQISNHTWRLIPTHRSSKTAAGELGQ